MVGELRIWPSVPFGELIESFDSIRMPVKEADRKPGPYPYYGASGIVDFVDGYLFDGEYLLVAEDGENLRTKQTPIAFLATGKFWVNNHAHIVKASEENDTRFLMYSIRMSDVGSYLTGSTMPKLTQGNLHRVPVVAPPLPEQRAIAHVLGTLDDKIEINRKMSETLEELARTLFKSWFVDFDPVHAKAAGKKPFGMDDATAALFPNSFEDSELGPIPRGWRVGTLGQWADIRSGGTPSRSRPELWNGDVPWISPKVMTAIHADDPDQFVTEGAIGNGTRVAPARSTLVMVRGMALHQGVRVSQTQREVVFNQDVKALVPRQIHPDLLLFALLDAQTSLLSKVHAAGHGTGVLGTDMLNAVTLCLPRQCEQPPFAESFATLNDRIALARAESRTLAELRDTLLPKLLSGELRVPLDVVGAADTGRGQLGLFESV
ncbi:MAG: restriction endonuclease subunit S [Myxococcales bacterium]|nr:restriction endonuclease subunit S [Myxococcales bacterium]